MSIICSSLSQSKPEGDEEEKVEDGEPAEPEAEEMTLEEYRESLKEAKMPAKSFNIRKAGEGVDNTQWKKMYVLKKKEEPEEEDDEDEVFFHRRGIAGTFQKSTKLHMYCEYFFFINYYNLSESWGSNLLEELLCNLDHKLRDCR